MLGHPQSGVCPRGVYVQGSPWRSVHHEPEAVSCAVTQGNNTRQERQKWEGVTENRSSRGRMAAYLGPSPCKMCL